MKIEFSPYSLRKKHKLNAADSGEFQTGCLVRVWDNDNNWGVADYCPKSEFGDLSFEAEIKNKGPMYKRAIELALRDLNARQNKISLLKNLFVKNNYLITDFRNQELNRPEYANNTIKIKADADTMSLALKLNNIHEDIKVRLDFNSSLNETQFELFLSFLNEKAKAAIEYIEDPTPLNDKWKIWNTIVPLAFDFQKAEYKIEYAKYRINKPEREIEPENMENITFTSAMGHKVGLAHGLSVAQQRANNDSGFLTLDVFEEDAFNKYFSLKNNYLNFTDLALNDYGIGMTEELKKLNWMDTHAQL